MLGRGGWPRVSLQEGPLLGLRRAQLPFPGPGSTPGRRKTAREPRAPCAAGPTRGVGVGVACEDRWARGLVCVVGQAWELCMRGALCPPRGAVEQRGCCRVWRHGDPWVGVGWYVAWDPAYGFGELCVICQYAFMCVLRTSLVASSTWKSFLSI